MPSGSIGELWVEGPSVAAGYWNQPALNETLFRARLTSGGTGAYLRTGDLALVTAEWQLAMTGPDGNPATMTGQSVEVLRRQPDGRWLFAIDFPFGVG